MALNKSDKENVKTKKINFENIYSSLRLNTVHRYFNGTDSSLLAVFTLFELLHNLRNLVNEAYDKNNVSDYAVKWYKRAFEGDSYISANPVVYKYVFGRKWLSKKTKKRVLDTAQKEFIQILERSGIGEFINKIIEGDAL